MDRALFAKIKAANSALLVDGNLERIEEFFSTDYVAHTTARDYGPGHDALRRFFEMIRRAFPVVRVEVELLVEGRDRVAWQRTLRGIQHNSFRGMAASGRKIVWRDMVTSRFRDELIAEEWVISDLAERLLRAMKH